MGSRQGYQTILVEFLGINFCIIKLCVFSPRKSQKMLLRLSSEISDTTLYPALGVEINFLFVIFRLIIIMGR